MNLRVLNYWFATSLLVSLCCLTVSAQSVVNVKFAKGKTSATYNGTIKGGRYVDYKLNASEGQTMTVALTRRSGEPPYFNVLKGGSEVAIADDAREVTKWSGQLSSSDTYVIRVYVAKAARLAGRTSNFRLTVSVTDSNNMNSEGSRTVQYDCGQGVTLTADFTPGPPPQVRIRYGTQDINLPLEPSGSGSKYEFNNQMFWVKGDEARLESKVLNADCKVQP